jgi:hypothetical protein
VLPPAEPRGEKNRVPHPLEAFGCARHLLGRNQRADQARSCLSFRFMLFPAALAQGGERSIGSGSAGTGIRGHAKTLPAAQPDQIHRLRQRPGDRRGPYPAESGSGSSLSPRALPPGPATSTTSGRIKNYAPGSCLSFFRCVSVASDPQPQPPSITP